MLSAGAASASSSTAASVAESLGLASTRGTSQPLNLPPLAARTPLR